MPFLKEACVIGLTGSFGSGCTTMIEVLKNSECEHGGKRFRYKAVSLSGPVKERWLQENWSKIRSDKPLTEATDEERNEALKKAKRSVLQDIGNAIREKEGLDRLAQLAVQRAEAEYGNIEDNVSLIFNSIRNTAEIKRLKEEFPNFCVIAVDCPRDVRWRRVRPFYESQGLTEANFEEDDKRDKGEDTPHGQQVELCIDEADIMIKNADDFPEKAFRMMKIEEKARNYIELVSGETLRSPRRDEFFMSLAYTASLNSRCFKRQVGAAIVDAEGNLLTIGYNENLPPHEPCPDDPGDCPRDIYKREYFRKLKEDKTATCPKCKEALDYSLEFKCQKCGFDLDAYFIPDKALSRCTALHAEARAIRALRNGELHKGSAIYTTASPCLTCAVEIVNAGLKEVVYSEAYTDTKAMEFMKKEGIETKKFEGVKANAFFRVFSSWRGEKEREIKERIKNFGS